MKSILSLTCSILFTTLLIAQSNLNWTTLNTGTNKKINAIYFHSPDTGYIVGDNYLFKKTTNGGVSWTNLTAPIIGEKPSNNGKIIDIEFFTPTQHGFLPEGLYLTWENGYHTAVTNNDGASYVPVGYSDSNQFCGIEGLFTYPKGRATTFGYKDVYVYGANCNGNSESFNYFDGPFSTFRSDTFKTSTQAKFTDADADYISTIFGHSDGYLLKHQRPFSFKDTIFLDSSGVSAVAYAGNNKWYAKTNRNSNNMYVSVDTGKTFAVDGSYQTFLNPTVNEFSFLDNGVGIAAATNSVTSGAILVQNNNSWNFDLATQPLYAAQILNSGVAYVAGDSGLVMKTTIITSINEVNHRNSVLQIYPNPTNGTFTVEVEQHLTYEVLQIFNLSGKLIKEQQIQSTKESIDVSTFANGIYMLKYGTTFKKLVVTK